MKNWLVNLLLGYDFKKRIKLLEESSERKSGACFEKSEEIKKLKSDIDNRNEELTKLRTKYHKLECDNLEKQNKIVELSEELELAIESINIQKVMSDTRLEAKERLEEELKDCKEKYIIQRDISTLRTKERNDFKDTINDLKEEVAKLKKINQEMSGKKRGVK